MPPDFVIFQLTKSAAAVEACITTDFVAHALDCSPDAARATLKLLTDAGYLRPLLVPGLGNKICYQPTPKAACLRGANVPKFFRAGLSSAARWRGLLRGAVRFISRPDLAFLTAEQQTELCRKYGVPAAGHARALVGLDGAHYHIFVPVLQSEKPIAAIEAAAFRWLPLLESGCATLHFVAQTGEPAAATLAALVAIAPTVDNPALSAKLAFLDAEIAADHTGLAALRFASQRASLLAEIEAVGTVDESYSWLGGLVEAQL